MVAAVVVVLTPIMLDSDTMLRHNKHCTSHAEAAATSQSPMPKPSSQTFRCMSLHVSAFQ